MAESAKVATIILSGVPDQLGTPDMGAVMNERLLCESTGTV